MGLRIIFLFLAVAGAVFGQSAEVSGLVKDPSGGAITGAQLQLRNQSTGIRYEESTNADGFYTFASVKPGTYEATVQAEKFRTLTQEAIVLNVAERASLDFSLQLPIVAQSITVNSQPALLDSTDPAISTVVDQQFVQNTPLNGRSFQSGIADGMDLFANAKITARAEQLLLLCARYLEGFTRPPLGLARRYFSLA